MTVTGTPREAAEVVAATLAAAAANGEQIALAGGSTPRLAYELAAGIEPDWSRAGLWWGDERCVPPEDARSNFRLVRESLLERVARQPEPDAVHRIRGELAPEEAAAAYDAQLRGGRLDLVLLGLGEDGHTASLFPNAPSLEERERLAVAAAPGQPPDVPRVTLTLPALAAARTIVFLAVGAGKADAVARAFAQPPGPATPASLVRARDGRTAVVLDEDAAARLG